jgi:hypothetical protein
MTKSTKLTSSLSALAIAGAIAAVHTQSAAAQSATNLKCDGCVNSKDIQDEGVKAQDLAPGLITGTTVFVNAGSNATKNCNKLRSALSEIADATAANPVLVRIERGNYNCGSTPVALKQFVTIEGAGQSFSKIIGNTSGFDTGVVTGANDATVRKLTLEHKGSGTGTAIVVNTLGSRMSIADIDIKLESATANEGYGIVAGGGGLDLTNVSVRTSASNGQSQGILGVSAVKMNMRNVWVHNQSGAFGNPAALELRDTSSVTAFGILFSSNFFGLLGRDDSVFELFGGTVIGGRGAAGTPSFSCVGVADADFTARSPDCS